MDEHNIMTEHKWMISKKPRQMLSFLLADGPFYAVTQEYGRHEVVSDRKLRLFACACRRRVPGLPWDGDSAGWQYMEDHPEADVLANNAGPHVVSAAEHARLFLGRLQSPSQAEMADLLRDIFGNPFRLSPAEWREKRDGEPDRVVHRVGQHWLTPTVVSLAQAAYDERPGQKRWTCNDAGKHSHRGVAGTMAHGVFHAANPMVPHHHHDDKCPFVIEGDGSLDAATLTILADALTDAGCRTPRRSIRVSVFGRSGGHCFEVVAEPTTPGNLGIIHTEKTLSAARKWAEKNCAARAWRSVRPENFHATGGSDLHPILVSEAMTPEREHPLVAHLRSPGPHVRGCWAVDLLLGKS